MRGRPSRRAWPLALWLAWTFAAHATSVKIKHVHIVFSNHLDIGFGGIGDTPGFDDAVISTYFQDHFPKAVRVAQSLRDRGGSERLVYLTHSWLVSLYLECPERLGIKCPDREAQEAFEEAVERGDITWHAFPHNAHIELFDSSLLAFAVELTHRLDDRFKVPRKRTLSQRDVPGLSRAALPTLAEQGVRAVSVGVNGGSAPPGVRANRPFLWEDPGTGARVLAFWHPGGYSGEPVDAKKECVRMRGYDRALCLAWRGDNAGPPDEKEVLDVFQRVSSYWPSATLQATGFEEWTDGALACAGLEDDVQQGNSRRAGWKRDQAGRSRRKISRQHRCSLPVLRQEIGDTWIHGAASDPGKLSEYRALARLRRSHLWSEEDEAFFRFSRLLLKLPEHTWGVDIKATLADYEHWSNADFARDHAARPERYRVPELAWMRQRAYALWAVQELGNGTGGMAAWDALAALRGLKKVPAVEEQGLAPVDLERGEAFESKHWKFILDPVTGAFSSLQFLERGKRGAFASAHREESSLPLLRNAWRGAWAATARAFGSLRFARGWGLGSTGVAPDERGPSPDAPVDWASAEEPLGAALYSTYAETDYEAIWSSYAYRPDPLPDWFYKDFGKPNATALGGARRGHHAARVTAAWAGRDGLGGLKLIIRTVFPDWIVDNAGAPAALWTEISAPSDSRSLSLDVVWEGKTATRLPEALWWRWVPAKKAVDVKSWTLVKLDQPVSPLDVVLNGSHALHAVGDDAAHVRSADARQRLAIRSLDAAVVCVGMPTPFPVLQGDLDLGQGVSFLLHNNIWGTNYPMWVPYQPGDEIMRFRFALEVQEVDDE